MGITEYATNYGVSLKKCPCKTWIWDTLIDICTLTTRVVHAVQVLQILMCTFLQIS